MWKKRIKPSHSNSTTTIESTIKPKLLPRRLSRILAPVRLDPGSGLAVVAFSLVAVGVFIS
jgi:hypothetical protein